MSNPWVKVLESNDSKINSDLLIWCELIDVWEAYLLDYSDIDFRWDVIEECDDIEIFEEEYDTGSPAGGCGAHYVVEVSNEKSVKMQARSKLASIMWENRRKIMDVIRKENHSIRDYPVDRKHFLSIGNRIEEDAMIIASDLKPLILPHNDRLIDILAEKYRRRIAKLSGPFNPHAMASFHAVNLPLILNDLLNGISLPKDKYNQYNSVLENLWQYTHGYNKKVKSKKIVKDFLETYGDSDLDPGILQLIVELINKLRN